MDTRQEEDMHIGVRDVTKYSCFSTEALLWDLSGFLCTAPCKEHVLGHDL